VTVTGSVAIAAQHRSAHVERAEHVMQPRVVGSCTRSPQSQ
jgi:hypothetical protein